MAIPTSKLKDIAFSSDFNYEHVEKKGTIVSTLSSTEYIAHSLSYAPYVKVFYVYGGGTTVFQAGYSYASPYQVIVDSQPFQLRLDFFSGVFGTAGDPITIHYRIYKERAV